MKNLFLRAGAPACALLVAASAATISAQTTLPQCRNAGGSYFPCGGSVTVDKNGMAIDASNPLPITPGPLSAATSTPLAGTVTSTSVTPTSGAATIAGSTATIGPLTPTLGRDIALKLWTTNGAAFSCQMFDSIDGGVTKLPLSIFDTPIGGPYTGPVNSVITSESVNGSTVYLVCTVTSGTLNYWSGQ